MMLKTGADIRDAIFESVAKLAVTASIKADDQGLIAEIEQAKIAAGELGLKIVHALEEGGPVNRGDEILRVCGSPKQIALAEDRLMGIMAKPSGIATSARRFLEKAGSRPRIVSGAYKKMPAPIKDAMRRAVDVGGIDCRICPEPFLYLDKNYVAMLGGLLEMLRAVSQLKGYKKVVQVKGAHSDIAHEARLAAENGAHVIFVDSGEVRDLEEVSQSLISAGLRDKVEIAFGGSIRLEDMEHLKTLDVDILDVGRAILDAPLLDMRLEIMGRETTNQ